MYSPSSVESEESASSDHFSMAAGSPDLPQSNRLVLAKIWSDTTTSLGQAASTENGQERNTTSEQPRQVSMEGKYFRTTVSPTLMSESISSLNRSDSDTFLIHEGYETQLVCQSGPDSAQMTAEEYGVMVEMARDAISGGVCPERISAGSSGSYFVKSRYGNTIGVFKPRDEEPYSKMNPKWTKWIHRNCCPCCFGRSCVMAGAGYLSEAAASIVDRFLGLGLVPRTEVIDLGAPTLAYTLWEHWQAMKMTREDAKMVDRERPYTAYREKLGSFQIFVDHYQDGGAALEEIRNTPVVSEELQAAFQERFERLVVLDYTIRNTDRGLDNFLVKIDWEEEPAVDGEKRFRPLKPKVRLAAIDNGLAFPYKHPDNWRSYPFAWSNLEPYVHTPFSASLSSHLLSILLDRDNWDQLEEQLRELFRLDINFRERTFQRQMAVMRGQLRNLVDCLMTGGKTPADLVAMAPLLVQEQDAYFKDQKKGEGPLRRPIRGEYDEQDSTEGHPRWKRAVEVHPIFTNF